LDIKKRLTQTNATGTFEFKSLSDDLESRFSSLSLKQAKLEEAFNKKVASLDKTTTSLENSLGKVDKTLKSTLNIINALKTDRKLLESALAKIDLTLAPVRKDLKNVSAEIKALDLKLVQELAGVAGTGELLKLAENFDETKQELKQLRTDVSMLSSTQLDKEELDRVLKNEQKNYQQQLSQITKKFASQTQKLGNRLDAIQGMVDNLESVSKLQQPKSTPGPAKKPAGKIVIPEPGKIIEQDIQS
jgi:chromosome segregation ATPase